MDLFDTPLCLMVEGRFLGWPQCSVCSPSPTQGEPTLTGIKRSLRSRHCEGDKSSKRILPRSDANSLGLDHVSRAA